MKRNPHVIAPATSPEAGQLADELVLYVDAHADSRELMATGLAISGAVVITAASADEALAVFEYAIPSVVVSELALPDVDGFAFVQMLRDRDAQNGGRVPAIAFTATSVGTFVDRALESGFDAIYAKPCAPGTLARAAARLLAIRRDGPVPPRGVAADGTTPRPSGARTPGRHETPVRAKSRPAMAKASPVTRF